jgi:F-type H+-transporting ATPase subunit a
MGGPMVAMRPIMIPMKIVSDIAIPISLACRLFGNMLGGMIVMELLKGALGGYASGIPGIAGLYFNLFHPLIQAYIFITLSLTFIDEAMEGLEE